jgi:hypothetical protein
LLAGAALVALALPFVCSGDGASSWLHAAGLGADAPAPEPQTRIAALQPQRGPERPPEREALPCTSAADCADGRCTRWFEDADADGFGNPDTGRGSCGDRAPASRVPLVRNGQDCCDLNDRVRPTQTEAFSAPIQESCPLARGYDYDCDGVIRYGDDMGASVWAGACDASSNAINDPNTPCVERGGVFLGQGNALGLTLEDLVTADGQAALCGNGSVEYKSCSLAGSTCEGRPSTAPPCN